MVFCQVIRVDSNGHFIFVPINTNQVCIGAIPNLNNKSRGRPIFILLVLSAKIRMQNSKQAEALDCKIKYFNPHSIPSELLSICLKRKEKVIVLISKQTQIITQFLEEKHNSGVAIKKRMTIK